MDFRGPLPVGARALLATVTVVNVDAEGPSFTVCNLGECGSEGITVVPACAAQDAEGECALIDPDVIAVSPTATSPSNACAGMQFTVTEIAPGKLSINPATGQHIVLPPLFRCRIDLTIDILKAPAFDSRPDQAGLQTTQVAEVVSTEDLAAGAPFPERSSGALTFDIAPAPPAAPRAPVPRGVLLRGGFGRPGSAGMNAFRYSGRVRGRRLAPGRYRLAALATDAATNSSRLVTAPFRVLRGASGR